MTWNYLPSSTRNSPMDIEAEKSDQLKRDEEYLLKVT